MPVPTEDAPAPAPPPGRFARMLPPAWRAEPGSRKSLRKMVALAAPERKPLTAAVGLLLVSSAVTMTVPLTIGEPALRDAEFSVG
jgi:putative ABC transport system ATP-binding protein